MDPNLESASSESSSEDEATNTATPLDAGDEGATPDSNQEAAPESSPGADEKETVSEEDFDPLSVVKAAVEKSKEPEEGDDEDQSKQTDDSSKSESDGQKKEDEPEELGEVTEEELKGYKPTTRKRIEGLLDDRQRLTERVSALEPAAEQMETLQEFMQERSLTPQNVSELMVVGGLAMSDDDSDVQAAITRTEEFLGQLKARLGDVLPPDLQTQVEEGQMTAEGAKEVALARVRTQRADQQVQNANTRVETVQQTSQGEADTAKATVVHRTISDWQSNKAATDPDYPRKAALLSKEIQLRVLAEPNQRVLDPTRAHQIAEEAYAEVTATINAFSPPKTPEAKKVLQSKGSSGSGNMASTPNSPLEAARAGLSKTAG